MLRKFHFKINTITILHVYTTCQIHVNCDLSDARLRVLDVMNNCQDSPRPFLKENGPVYGMYSITSVNKTECVKCG